MVTKTFKRHELKYFVTPAQFEAVRAALCDRMDLDKFCKKNGSYMIYNLYFDTPEDDVIRLSLQKPYYKEKLRMRSYTMPTCGEDTVFLELKKKIDGVVAKRRAIMTYDQATAFLEQGVTPELTGYEDNQVLHEIICFLKRHLVTPKVFISYERIAFADREDPDLRVSFDFNIITRREKVSLTGGDWGTELLDSDNILMEIKCAKSIPLWLCHMMSAQGIHRTSFSKYGTEYKKQVKRTNSCPMAAIG